MDPAAVERLRIALGFDTPHEVIEYLNSPTDPALLAEMNQPDAWEELEAEMYPYGNPHEMDPEDRAALEAQGLILYHPPL